MGTNDESYFSKSLEKGMKILSLFDRDHTRRSLAEITKITGFNKTSAYRFVNTLVALGYLKKSNNNRAIKLGPKALLLGQNFVQGFDLLQTIKPLIDNNFIERKVTIDSALLYDLTLISLYRREAVNLIHLRLPMIMTEMHARAMGKVVLAYLPENEKMRYFETCTLEKYTPNTTVDRDELLAELDNIKMRGYAINNEEYVSGLVCMGAPLINYQTQTVVGAVSFDFPASEYSPESIERDFTGVVTKLAGDISEMITMAES